MWKILTAASTAVALLGTPALADMADWDSSADSMIDRDEFGTGFGEGQIFADWDADVDAQLSEDEWTTGLGDRDDDKEFGTFSEWDLDQDSYLEENEFNDGMFGAYDTDADDLWGDEEYGAFYDDEWF